MAKILIRLINEGTPLTPSLGLRSGASAKALSECQEVMTVGKFIGAAVLAFLGLGTLSDYPVVAFGMLAAGALLVWMALQSRQAVRVERARPTAAREARADVQSEVNRAQRAANREMRQTVERARREAQRNVDDAVQRVRAEQAQRWIA